MGNQADRDEGRGDGGLTTAEPRRADSVAPREQTAADGARNPGESRSVVCAGDRPDFEAIFGFVKANHDRYPVGVMCRLLSVSRNGFYDWTGRIGCRLVRVGTLSSQH
jgi:hypothetical protein